MDIIQYLIELLKTYKQIGVEGLGTFYKKKTPGRYDAETHSFLPPSYVLDFTTDVLENTILVQYIHTKRGISEDSAKYFIKQFVEELQTSVQKGEYALSNLGLFNLINGQLTFNASQDINIGFDFFALPAVNADLQKQNVSSPEDENTTESTSPIATEPDIEHVQMPEFEQEMNKIKAQHEDALLSETAEQVASPNDVVENEKVGEISTESDETVTPNQTQEEVTEESGENEISTTAELTSEALSITENEPTQQEVYEEITEVNPENPTNEPEAVVEKEKGDSISATDNINEEKDSDKDDSNSSFTPPLINEFDNDEADQAQEKSAMPLYQKLVLGLVILLVLLAIVYFVKPSLFDNFIRKDVVNQNEKVAEPIQRSDLKTQQDSLSFADSIMKNAEKVGLDVQPAKDTIVVTTAQTTVKPVITYDIIAAAFAKQTEVDEFIALMKRKGFEAKIANMPGKIYKKISIASYNNIDSAQKYLVKYRKQFKNPKMYVQPIKNK